VTNDRRERLRIWHNHDAVSVPGPNLFASKSTTVTAFSAPAVGGPLLAAGDPQSTRIVYAMVIGLSLIGILFVLLGIWVSRQTRVDLEVLAPLERMGDRDWRKSDPASQRRSLDETRPDGAQPLQSEQLPPRVDTEFEKPDRVVQSFDDLTPLQPEGGDPTPAGGATVDSDAGDSGDDADEVEPGNEAEAEGADGPGAEAAGDAEVSDDPRVEAAGDAEHDGESEDESDEESGRESGEQPDSETAQPVEQ